MGLGLGVLWLMSSEFSELVLHPTVSQLTASDAKLLLVVLLSFVASTVLWAQLDRVGKFLLSYLYAFLTALLTLLTTEAHPSGWVAEYLAPLLSIAGVLVFGDAGQSGVSEPALLPLHSSNTEKFV